MAVSEIAVGPASVSDLPGVAALMRAELGEDISAEDLKWWFFDGPPGGASIEIARDATGVVGMATVKDAAFRFEGSVCRFGMPQKVLVAESLRGKGLFGRLYRASEATALRRGVTRFLTFTNKASTPIFLSKFGYRRGRCPDVLAFPWNVRAALCGPAFEVVKNFQAVCSGKAPLPAKDSGVKDWDYFRWRYGTHRPDRFVVLEVKRGRDRPEVGWGILRHARKGGLPVTLMMDFIGPDEGLLPAILDAAIKYSSRRGAVALLALREPQSAIAAERRMQVGFPERFNFLVKGLDSAETAHLARMDFEFTLGDLDFT